MTNKDIDTMSPAQIAEARARMMKEQVKFVAVRPNGTICGPMGDTWDEVKIALQIGHRRAGGDGNWDTISKQGYSIRQARIGVITHD